MESHQFAIWHILQTAAAELKETIHILPLYLIVDHSFLLKVKLKLKMSSGATFTYKDGEVWPDNPMEVEDWQRRWNERKIGFHHENIHP